MSADLEEPAQASQTPLQVVGRWRHWLDQNQNRGVRAELKRCKTLDSVVLHPACLRLQQGLEAVLPRAQAELVAALTAAVLPWMARSTVDTAGASDLAPEFPSRSLPALLGERGAGDNPRFSEMRFRRLITARDAEALVPQLRRALVQVDGKADFGHLANTALQHARQTQYPDDNSGTRQWQYRWSRDYYNAVLKYKQD